MTKSFEKNIDDLKFQIELGVSETISANITKDINKANSLETNSSLEHDSNELSEIKTLNDLQSFIENYDECELSHTARSTVFCDGNVDAEIMLIGEAPGNQEDIEGKPFVGKSGQLLDKILETININRTNCYISNIIPWRPPGNRNPTAEEISMCLPFIKKHIELINPKVLLLVGSISSKSILNKNLGITKLRGEWHIYKDGEIEIPALPIFHPAYLLRRPNNKSYVMRDILLFKRKIQDMKIL
tara:strand:+ start:1194 stop:1925 length:732 start_codon:yes stop_codon:yes gene_type:complete